MKRKRFLQMAIGASLLLVAAGGVNESLVRAQGRESATMREMNERARRAEPLIRDAARAYGVDPRVLWTIAYLETRFQTGLVSPKGARGMMQFMPATATRYGLTNPYDAAAAINAAARYVRDLSRRFNNRFDLVLAGYNAGEGTVEAYLYGNSLRLPDGRIINPNRTHNGGIPPYTETRNYVARGVEVARTLSTANIFALSDSTTRNILLSLPSESSGKTHASVLSSENEPAQTAPTFIPHTSSYAFNRTEEAATEETNAQPPSPTNVVAPVVARSFRVLVTNQSDELSQRGNSNPTLPRASTNAPVTVASQPRSTYFTASAPQR